MVDPIYFINNLEPIYIIGQYIQPVVYEDWRSINDYENYEVSTLSRVRNINTGRVLKPEVSRGNRNRVSLSKNGEVKKHFTYRLAGTAFLHNPDNLPQINHIDGHSNNDIITNIEWCNQEYNIRHYQEFIITEEEKQKRLYYQKIATEINKKKIAKLDINTEKILDIYESLTVAENTTGIDHRRISEVASGKRVSAGGFKWKYL